MLTENQLEMLGDKGAALIQASEQDIIADIARRIKKTGRFTETAELQVMALRRAGYDTQKIRVEVMRILNADPEYKKMVANETKQYKRDVMIAIRQMEREAEEAGDRIIAEAGDMSFNRDLYAWHQAGQTLTKDSSIVKLIEEMSIATQGMLKNLTRTMGFKGPHDFTSLENAYIRTLDKALMNMVSGGMSYDAAVEQAVREMAKSGLRSVDYASGRTYQLDTAVRMCVRTSAHQLSAKISNRNCDIMNTDLVEVSKHWGARPSHAVWQGKIYSRSGKNKKYPPFSECHYGEADGLCGINCRHIFYPFFEGISEPNTWPDEPEPKEYNGKMYDYYSATQKQRAMERGIRATKREVEAMRSIGGETGDLQSQIKKQVKEYHKFSHKMGISPKDNRLRVVKGSSDLNRTETIKAHNATKTDTTAIKNKLENTANDGTMKLNLQYFAEKDIVNQSSNSLKRAIRKYQTGIAEHEDKISNPQAYVSDWDNKDEREQKGLIKHWNKEIRNFNQSINDRIKELKDRGDYDE